MRSPALLFAALGLLVCAGSGRAQMTPLSDERETYAHAELLGLTQTRTSTPLPPFSYFNTFDRAVVEDPDPNGLGACEAVSFQVSQWYPAGMSASGTTSAGQSSTAGSFMAWSNVEFDFAVETCIEYQFDAWVKPGDAPDAALVTLSRMSGGVEYHRLEDGELHLIGRLSPGDYSMFGTSRFSSSAQSFNGGTYAFQWTCAVCPDPLIAEQPSNVLTPCDASAVFFVTTSVPASSLTFQWRRNGVPLTNDGHTSGVNTPSLTIADPCHPDSGYYDVLVGNGTVIEPSSVAQLTIGDTNDVPLGTPALPSLQVALAGPNPFSRETSFRYSATRPQHARIAIHDISGARIRTLADRELVGAGMLTWDGRTSSGTRAPAGVYFMRVEAGEPHPTCRVVLLD